MKNSTFLSQRLLLLIFAVLALGTRLRAQDSTTCLQFTFPVVEAQAGDTVCIPLLVRDFDLIAAIQFGVYWDSTDISLVRVETGNSQIPGLTSHNFNPFAPGRCLFAWDTPTLMGVSAPDSSILFQLCFRVLPGFSGYSPLKIAGLLDYSPFEAVQMLPPDWHTVLLPLTQQIGGVSVGAGSPGTLAFTSMCTGVAKCGNNSGSATVEVYGGVPPYTYQWSGPNGFTGTTATADHIFSGNYRVTATDQTGATVVAEMAIGSTPSDMSISTQVTYANCNQSDGCATLQISGGVPPYSYEWSQAGGMGNSHCALAPGNYKVTVSDANGCTSTKNIYIGNKSDFWVNLEVHHIVECNGVGSITAQPNGVGPYQYLWSTGDTTQTISNLLQGVYWVSVTSGDCTQVVSAQLAQSQALDWKLYGQGICSSTMPHTAELQLRTQKSGFNHFPLTVAYSDGSTHVITDRIEGVLLDKLENMPEGMYTIHVTDSSGCGVTVSVQVDCAEMPPVPDGLTAFYIKDDYLNLQYKIDSCAGVYARHFENMKTLSFSLNFNGAQEISLRKMNLPGLDLSDFQIQSNEFKLGMYWHSESPVSFPDDSLLFEMCFKGNNGNNFNAINFDNEPQPVSLVDADSIERAFIGMEGYVMFGLYFPLQPSVCEFGVVPPDCVSDGRSQIILGQCNPNLAFGANLFNESHSVFLGKIGSMLSVPAGEYRVNSSQLVSQSSDFYVKIPAVADSSACVWPGDADDNNAVNHYDLLYLGMAYGAQGPARNGSSLEWQGWDAPQWSGETQLRHVNFKNIDTNGDGIINAEDTTAIVQNWGRVVHPFTDQPFGAPGLIAGTPIPPLLTIPSDTLMEGHSFRLPVLLGSQAHPVDSMYGLGFSVAYDPKFVKSIRFLPVDSWLGDSTQLLSLQKNFHEQGHIDIALTRTNGVPVSGSGVIGTMFVIIEDNIFAGIDALLPNDSSAETRLYLRGLNSVNAKEKLKMLDAPSVDLLVQKNASTAARDLLWERRISLYPNPAATTCYVGATEVRIEKLVMTDAAGRVVCTAQPEDYSAKIPVDHLRPGIYFVKIYTEKGLSIKKINISR